MLCIELIIGWDVAGSVVVLHYEKKEGGKFGLMSQIIENVRQFIPLVYYTRTQVLCVCACPTKRVGSLIIKKPKM